MNSKTRWNKNSFNKLIHNSSLFSNVRLLISIFLALFISTALVIQSAAGAGTTSDGGQAPTESDLALPKVFGEPRSVRVAPALGAVADQISLVVPPGRRGIEPHLTLNYSSMAGLGTLGLGWFLETGYVEVWRGDGTPTVGNPDSFMYSLSGAGGQLVNIGDGVYRAKLESIYREFCRNQEHGGWEMYNGEGALHRFGGTPNSRIPGQQWMIDYVKDPHGNTINYTYERVGDVLYISKIQYTGYAPTGDLGANLVEFEYENRDDVRIDYGLSLRQEKTRRLKRISLFASGQLARRYEFKYEDNPLNGMSMLKKVILVGADDVSRITLRELEYSTRSIEWNELESPYVPGYFESFPLADNEGRDTGVRLSDVNGDGFADMITNGTSSSIYLGIGDGNFATEYDTNWSESLQAANVQFAVPSGDYQGADKGVRFLDVNSDGLSDLFIAQTNRRQIYLNTGSGWSYTEEVCSGELCTTGEQWSTGVFGLDSISSQAVYSNTTYVVPPGVYDDTHSGWTYNGSWMVASLATGAYENTLHTSDTVGNSASITFHGTQFILRYTGDTDRGEVEISVDESYLATLNQHSDTQAWQAKYSSPVLEDGVHTIEIEHLSGSIVDIDAIEFLNVDEIPPAAISDLEAASGEANGSVNLNWTSPGDDGDSGIPTRYLVRHSASEILAESDWDTATPIENGIPLPGIAGISKGMTVSDLTPGETYYFAVRAQDEADNLGALSNSPFAQATSTPPTGGRGDETPPGVIVDLTAEPGSEIGSAELSWTAPGDDDYTGTAIAYLVRYSTDEILTKSDWASAVPVGNGTPVPGSAGTLESMTVSELTPGEIYYFATRAQDDQGNLSGLSNSPGVEATSEPPTTGRGGDMEPPAAIIDLAAASGPETGSVELSWTAPGDDGVDGTASAYLVRHSAEEILTETDWNSATPVESDIPTPGVAGTPESMTLMNLVSGATYYFAIRAGDEADNISELSNSPGAKSMGIYDDTHSDWHYSSEWVSESASEAYGGSYHYVKSNNSYATLELQGSQFKLYYTKGKDFGQLQIFVDDVLVDTLNQHDNQQVYRATWLSPVFEDEIHLVKLVKKSGKGVNIDALEILTATDSVVSTHKRPVSASFHVRFRLVESVKPTKEPSTTLDIDNVIVEPFALVENEGDSKGVQLTDVNADGRVDIVWSYSRTPEWWESGWFGWLNNTYCNLSLYFYRCNVITDIRGVFLNTGTGWELDPTLTEALKDVDFFVKDSQLMGYDMLDVNADGLADIVRTLESQPREVRLGTGSDWEYDAGFSASMETNDIISLSADEKSQGLMPIDFNDDGLVDYLQANETITKAYANTGKSWIVSSEMTNIFTTLGIAFSTSDGKGTGYTFSEFNGDGLLDIVKAKWNQPIRILSSDSLRSGIIVQSTSSLGEVTALTWTSSTQFDNTRENGVQGLPGSMPVVASLTRNDGQGNSHTTTYTYGGGWLTNRQFRGFRWTEQVLPSGLRLETNYHQEEGLTGQRDVEYGYDAQDNLRLQTSSTYNIVEAAPGVRQLTNIRSEETWSDPGGMRRSAVEYTHDEYLNITSVYRDPDLDIDGDETNTTFNWIINIAAGFWNLPGRVTTHGLDGSVLAENILLYDHLPEGQAQYGLPSEARDLVEPGAYVVKSMEYDQYGNVERVYDRENNLYQFQYDATTGTFLVEAIDSENRTQQSKYDPRFGELIWDKDAAGNITTKEFDAFGRLTRFVLPGDEASPNGTQTIIYSSFGDGTTQHYTVKETEIAGEPGTLDTTYYFNGMGLVYRAEREGSGSRKVITTTEFDDADNPAATSRPYFEGDEPPLTTFERDELHRPLRITEPDGSEITTTYAGKRIDMIDQRGTVTSFYRDAEGNTTAIHQWVDGVEQVTSYQYDVLGQLVGITDALGEQTTITYDLLGRRTRLVDPNTGTYLYRYDNEGRLIEQVGPDGLATVFTYNKAGDLLAKKFPDGTAQEFTYDSAGRLSQVEDAAGMIEFAYDGRGNVTERKRTIDGKPYTTGYMYDSLNRILQVTYPDGFAIQYEYDPGGNLARITDNHGGTLADGMSYTASGQLLGIQFGNGVISNFAYDELMRMTSINTFANQDEALQNLAYSYDTGSNLLSITDTAFNASQSFEYDALGRLTKAIGAYGEEIYEYDPIGNLTRKGSMFYSFDPAHPQRVICGVDTALMRGNANGIENNPHSNPCENLPEIAEDDFSKKLNRIGGPANNPNIGSSFQIAYDAHGNAIQKGGMQYEYDSENHLVRVRDGKGKLLVENTYDAAGQRVLQRSQSETTVYIDGIYEEGKTHTSRHVQAGPLLIATIVLPRSAADAGQSAPPNSFNALAGMAGFMFVLVWMPFQQGGRRRWSAGLNALKEAVQAHPRRLLILLFILTAIVSSAAAPEFNAQASQALRNAEKRYYYHANHLGSINVVTDEKGKVVERREYKPYGDPYEWNGPKSGPREFLQTFDGQYYDDTIGMYYFGARHYDPQLGRFLAADTQVPDPTDPRTLHRYAFAGGNPIRYVDPTGHCWFCDALDWIVAIAFVIGAIAIGILTCGIGFVVASALAGAILFTIGMAAIGAGIAAIVALANGTMPLSDAADFWLAVAAGAVIGAAVGACLAALPASIGGVTAFGASTLGMAANFVASLAADILVGAMLGGLGTIANHLASGGSAADIFSESLGLEILTSSIKGAILSGIFGCVLNVGIYKFMEGLGRACFSVISGILLLESMGEIALNIWIPNHFGSLTYWPTGDDPNWFRNSPSKPLGIPAWAFAGTGAYTGRNQSRVLAVQLQTMPLAP